MKAMTLHRYRREVAHLFKYSQYGSCFNRRRWLQFFPNFCVFSISGQEKSPRCWGKVASDQPKFSWNFFSGPLGEQMCELDTCRNGAEADFFVLFRIARRVARLVTSISSRWASWTSFNVSINCCTTEAFPYRHFWKVPNEIFAFKLDRTMLLRSPCLKSERCFFSSNHFFPLFESENKIRRKKLVGLGKTALHTPHRKVRVHSTFCIDTCSPLS